MNNYHLSVLPAKGSLARKPMAGSPLNQRVRLSVTHWQQAKFVPVIVRQAPASRLNSFHS